MSMTRGLRNTGAILALALLASAPALAQQGLGVIVGTVTDASTKAPVADVVVTATAPSLPGEQIVVTDAQGQFRIPQLPAGTYTLRFEKEAYRPFARSDIPLRIDTTVRVNTELLPETAGEEEIVVVGKAPTVDVGSTNIGTNVGADFIRNIAVVRPVGKGGAARSFESLAEIAPGANADDYGVSIAGTTSPENSFIVDGLSVNDPAFGLLGTQLPVDFVQEVNVVTGGYMPEYGRTTGGVLNVVTKSGSNEFRGSVFANWAPGALQAAPRQIVRGAGTLATTNENWNVGDVGVELGGPIIKDKLWFFAGFDAAFQRNRVTRTFNTPSGVDDDPNTNENEAITPIEGAQRQRFADQRYIQFLAKLTYAVNQDNSLTLSFFGSPNSSGGANSFAFDPQSGGIRGGTWQGDFEVLSRRITSSPIDLTLKHNAAFLDKRVLLDTTLGWHHQFQSELPVDGSTLEDIENPEVLAGRSGVIWRRSSALAGGQHSLLDFVGPNEPGYANIATACAEPGTCRISTWQSGGPGFLNVDNLDRWQGKSVATVIFNALGSHTAKVGVDVEYMAFERQKAYGGGVLYREATNGGSFTEYRTFAYMTGPDETVYTPIQKSRPTSLTLGGFLQDSWSILNLVTLNAGVRYDAQTLNGADGRVGLALPNQWSPRIGLIYDFTQQGRSKIYANYARFFENVPLNLGDRAFGGERQTQAVRFRTANASRPGCNPQPYNREGASPAQAWPGGECRDPANLAQIHDVTDPNAFYAVTGGDRAMVDPNLKPQSSDEFVAGAEYQVIDNGRVGAFYTKRYMNSVIEDMSRDDAQTYFIGNPGEGIAADFPKARRDYDAVTVFFNKDFADLWMVQANYTWSNLRGNWAGLYRPETLQLDPNINSDFDLQSLLPNRDGQLPGDRTHSFKVYAAKEFVLGGSMSFNIGATYRGRSGTPISALGSHPLYGGSEVFLLPRGSVGRTPWRNDVDLRVGYNLKITDTNVLSVGVDFFNVFNFQTETAVDEDYTLSDVLPVQDPTANIDNVADKIIVLDADTATGTRTFGEDDLNPSYRRPVQYQAPRNIRLGAKITF